MKPGGDFHSCGFSSSSKVFLSNRTEGAGALAAATADGDTTAESSQPVRSDHDATSPPLSAAGGACLVAFCSSKGNACVVDFHFGFPGRVAEKPVLTTKLPPCESLQGPIMSCFTPSVTEHCGTKCVQLLVAVPGQAIFSVVVRIPESLAESGGAEGHGAAASAAPPAQAECACTVDKLVDINYGRLLRFAVSAHCAPPVSLQHPHRAHHADAAVNPGCILAVFPMCVVCMGMLAGDIAPHSAGAHSVSAAWGAAKWPVQALDAAPGYAAVLAEVFGEPPSSIITAPRCFMSASAAEQVASANNWGGFLCVSGRRLQLFLPETLLNSYQAAAQGGPGDVVQHPETARRLVLPWQAALRPGSNVLLPSPCSDGANVISWPLRPSPDALQECNRTVLFPTEHLAGIPWARDMLAAPPSIPCLLLQPAASWIAALPAAQSTALAALSRLVGINTSDGTDEVQFALLASLDSEHWVVPEITRWAPASAFRTPLDPHLPHFLQLQGADSAAAQCDGSQRHLQGMLAVATHCACMLSSCTLPLLLRACSLARQNAFTSVRQHWPHATKQCQQLLTALQQQVRVDCMRLARVRALGLAALRCLLLQACSRLPLSEVASAQHAIPTQAFAAAHAWLGEVTAIGVGISAGSSAGSQGASQVPAHMDLHAATVAALQVPPLPAKAPSRSERQLPLLDSMPVASFSGAAFHAVAQCAWALRAAACKPPPEVDSLPTPSLLHEGLLTPNCIVTIPSAAGVGAEQLLCALTMLPALQGTLPPSPHASAAAAGTPPSTPKQGASRWRTTELFGSSCSILNSANTGVQACNFGLPAAVCPSSRTAALVCSMFQPQAEQQLDGGGV